MDHYSACLLLFTCLAGISASDSEQRGSIHIEAYGPSSVSISGVDVITVGIPYGFRCHASCSPPCTFSWTTRGGVTYQGNELNVLLRQKEPAQVITCTAVNPATDASASAQKTLQVAVGPSNIKLLGPGFLTIGDRSVFTCSAECYPACSYTWTVMKGESVLTTAEGNTISLLPHPTADSETLICQAQDTLSQLFISTSVLLPVATLSDVYITGPSTVTMGQKSTFICFATCTPNCDYTWIFKGHTYIGNVVELHQGGKPKYCSKLVMTFDEYSNTVPLICQVKNDASQAVLRATKELTFIDPISVRPTTEAQPVLGKPFSLRCIGAKNPGSVTWQKNGLAIATSENVHFSSDGLTLAFSHLQEADSGLYQCLVSEGGDPIHSVGYNLTVIYGPFEVEMVNQDKSPVGNKMFALLGSKTELQCVADCSPPCGFAWYYSAVPMSTNASLLFAPTKATSHGGLSCVAYNRVTGKNMTSYTTVVVPDGPGAVTISGPESVEVGVTASFRCSAECVPPCSYTWSVYGRPMVGSEIEVTLGRYVSAESISCQAKNNVSGKMATVNETLQVSDPLWCGC